MLQVICVVLANESALYQQSVGSYVMLKYVYDIGFSSCS